MGQEEQSPAERHVWIHADYDEKPGSYRGLFVIDTVGDKSVRTDFITGDPATDAAELVAYMQLELDGDCIPYELFIASSLDHLAADDPKIRIVLEKNAEGYIPEHVPVA